MSINTWMHGLEHIFVSSYVFYIDCNWKVVGNLVITAYSVMPSRIDIPTLARQAVLKE